MKTGAHVISVVLCKFCVIRTCIDIQVSTNLPAPIPKCPLPAIEYSPTTEINMIGYTPSHSHTDTHSSPRSFSPDSTDSMGSLLNESGDSDQQGVFMTQVIIGAPPLLECGCIVKRCR